MRNRILIVLALAVAALGSVAGTVVPTAEALTDPMFGAPTAGQCYNMNGAAVLASPSATQATVPCSGRHTVMITAVLQVPSSIPVSFDNDAFNRYVSSKCLPSRVQASGGSKLRYGRSSYAGYAFIPTQAQQDQGAHWVSCMMGIAQGSSVLRITGRYPHLPAKLPAKLTFCVTSGGLMTNCAASHQWHPVTSAAVSSTAANIRTKAASVCRARLGATRWLAAWKLVAPTTTWVVSCMRS